MENVVNFLNDNPLLAMFLIATIGYAFGRIRIKGLGLGTAGILIIALVFGHFGVVVPSIAQNLGLLLFVTTIGLIAGPTFFKNFKSNAIAYVILGIVIVLSSVASCIAIIYLTGTPTDLSLGLLAGALTTTPGLAAGIESTGSSLVSVGYGIAYPFGVIAVVLFVQILPKILKTDFNAEKSNLTETNSKTTQEEQPQKKMFRFDPFGFFSLSIAIVVGYLIGKITIPLPGGAKFSLGISGGPLIAGLLFGKFNKIGRLDLSINPNTLKPLREIGLALFLMGAGTSAGTGFVSVIKEYGGLLFLWGAIMTIIPLIVGILFAKKIFKLNTMDSLGSICGGMTSTPALGSLVRVAGTDDVAASYAATYPIALATVVIAIQLIGTFL